MKSYQCPKFRGKIVQCPGFERCPTGARKHHSGQVDKKPQTREAIQSRKEELIKELEKQNLANAPPDPSSKTSRRPKSKAMGNIEKYIPEGFSPIQFVNGVMKHGVSICQQGREKALTLASLQETLKKDVSNYIQISI
jgi:hypothetical protein